MSEQQKQTLIKKLLQTIIKHCDVIEDTILHFGNEYNDFEKSVIYQNSILTPVIQIGELVKRLPDDFKQSHTEIPWRNIAGMRDIMVHSYETIDKVILWDVANKEALKIKRFCKKTLMEVN
ncbi:MAG: DUF86 domain-containing protein [Oscillospiraceae bacterium]|nr:DUF86 domain-containing protein [Oscillospiraceae bacterium]